MTPTRLRQVRRRLRLTQAQFADRVGVTANTVARWERGELTMRETTARFITILAQQPTKTTRRK
jgi:DNA-binding transcriptional regulator YiaG